MNHPYAILQQTATARKPNIEGSSEPTYYTRVALNLSLDRSPVFHGEIMPEKAKVQYGLPHTKTIKRLYFRQYNNERSFDWQNIEHIRTSNRGRAQLFMRKDGKLREAESDKEARLKELQKSEGVKSQEERVNIFSARADGAITLSSERQAAEELQDNSGVATPASDNSGPC